MTIIILLILAGVVINSITSENGLFARVKQAKNNVTEAQEQEETTLADYENIVDESINGSRETVTISKEEYEALIPSKITLESLLANCTNNSQDVGTYTFLNFTNDFQDNFDNYLKYDSTNGEISCKKSGWYLFRSRISEQTPNGTTFTKLNLVINDVKFLMLYGISDSGCGAYDESESMTMYLNENDKIQIEKSITGAKAYYRCNCYFDIYKL